METKLIYTLIIMALGALGLGNEMAKHGEEKTGKHNWWTTLGAMIVIWFLYYKAGLFDVFFQ